MIFIVLSNLMLIRVLYKTNLMLIRVLYVWLLYVCLYVFYTRPNEGCEVCMRAKHPRDSFPLSDNKASRIFEKNSFVGPI